MMKFAAFIMTYERPREVLAMIKCLFEQSFPPEKILVVDNSLSYDTQKIVDELNNRSVEYLRLGYNAGPAGAAKAGLKRLSAAGYDWVFWGDDNDPPRTIDAFERIFAMLPKLTSKRIGALGLIGNNFAATSAKVKVFKSEELKGIMSVNSLVGNGFMMINTDVIKEGVLPDEDLFFGYEELDFCLRIKSAGYDIFIDGDYYMEQRLMSKKAKRNRIQKVGFNSREYSLWREYYSIRNLMFILFYKQKSIVGTCLIFLRAVGKALFSFSKGMSFGSKYSGLVIRAIKDFIKKNMGLIVQPGSV